MLNDAQQRVKSWQIELQLAQKSERIYKGFIDGIVNFEWCENCA